VAVQPVRGRDLALVGKAVLLITHDMVSLPTAPTA
jgi:hypothetical protein